MAEAARRLEELQEPISERTRTALGNVIDLEQARQKQRLKKRRTEQQPNTQRINQSRKGIPSATTPANDNARTPARPHARTPATARGPQIEIQEGAPQFRDTEGRLGPTPNRTPIAMATELQSAQSQDRRAIEALPEPSSGGRAFLELEPQSYAKRSTQQQREQKRQEQMMQTSRDFLSPGTGGESFEAPQEYEQAPAPQERLQAEPRSGIAEQARAKGLLQRAAKESREQIASVQTRLDQIQEAQQKGRTFIKMINWAVKIISGVGSELVLPFIWGIFVFNVETINILFFRINLPSYANAFLSIAGLDFSVDRNNPFSTGNVLIIMITAFVDFFVFLIMLPTLIGMTIAIILIIFTLTQVLSFLNIGI